MLIILKSSVKSIRLILFEIWLSEFLCLGDLSDLIRKSSSLSHVFVLPWSKVFCLQSWQLLRSIFSCCRWMVGRGANIKKFSLFLCLALISTIVEKFFYLVPDRDLWQYVQKLFSCVREGKTVNVKNNLLYWAYTSRLTVLWSFFFFFCSW